MKFLAGFDIPVFLTDLILMEFQGKYFISFFSFLSIAGFSLFWIGSLHKNIQLMLEFLKAPLLVLQLFYYTFMTFLIMLSVIIPYMLMIFATLSVTRYLICTNNHNWFLSLNLIYETLWTRASGLLISMLGKLTWFRLIGLKTLALLM